MSSEPHQEPEDAQDEWSEAESGENFATGYPLPEELIEDNRIGQLLVRHRLITLAQLQTLLEAQEGRPVSLLGELAVEMGFTAVDDIQDVLRLQLAELRLGQILVKTRSITEAQLDIALAEQDQSGELLGSILIGFGFCAAEQVAWAIDQQNRD